ncbi:hypothetical protein C0991_000897, partial [Blastosporella zonata]
SHGGVLVHSHINHLDALLDCKGSPYPPLPRHDGLVDHPMVTHVIYVDLLDGFGIIGTGAGGQGGSPYQYDEDWGLEGSRDQASIRRDPAPRDTGDNLAYEEGEVRRARDGSGRCYAMAGRRRSSGKWQVRINMLLCDAVADP